MAALEGFEVTIDGSDDIAVADGLVNGDAVAGDTIAVTGTANGDYLIVLDTSDDSFALVAELGADHIQLGEATVDTDAATAVSLAGRGTEAYKPMADPAFYVDPSSYNN